MRRALCNAGSAPGHGREAFPGHAGEARSRRALGALVLLLLGLALLPAGAGAQAGGDGGGAADGIGPAPRQLPAFPQGHPGLAMLLGLHGFMVRAGEPEAQLEPSSAFSDGVSFGIGWVDRLWRVEYMRQIVRHDLPAGTTHDGRPVDRLAFETDQLWAHLGWRPWRPLFLGLGFGAQHRRILFTPEQPEQDPEQRTTESGLVGGALVEWAVAPPFLAQLRWIEDLDSDVVTVSGPLLVVAYLVPW